MLKAGEIFAERYRVVYKIGSGGFGSVYKAEDLILQRTVAIKLMHIDQASERDLIRFQSEGRLTAKLSHTSIVSILDFKIDSGNQPYLVLEYIQGTSLSDILRDSGNLDLETSVPVFMQIIEALSHAHSHGVIHRDLKPSNVLVERLDDDLERVKVVDFGIARSGDTDLKLTASGSGIGSPFYMSPEQARGVGDSPSCDVYSLGCLMYETLTGDVPFKGETALETLILHSKEPVPPMGSSLIEIPPEFEGIVRTCLEKDPSDRYQSMSEVRSAIEEFLEKNEKLQDEVQEQMARLAPVVEPTPSIRFMDLKVAKGLVVLGIVASGIAFTAYLHGGFLGNVDRPAPRPPQESSDVNHKLTSIALDKVSTGVYEYKYDAKNDLSTKVRHLSPAERAKVTDFKIDYGQLLSCDSLKALNAFPLKKLTIDESEALTDKLFLCLPDCPELQSLTLYDATNVTGDRLDVLSKYPRLESFILTSSKLRDTTFSLIPALDRLQYLELTAARELRGSTFKNISRFPRMKHLVLASTSITDSSIVHLSSLKMLERLNLDKCRNITGRTLMLLSELPLETLNLSGCPLKLAYLNLSKFKSLRSLSISGCTLDDSAISQLASSTVGVLTLSDTNITDKQLSTLLSRNKHITNISIAGCKNITEKSLVLLSSLPRIRYINYSRNPVDETGVRAISKAPRLNTVDLEFCPLKAEWVDLILSNPSIESVRVRSRRFSSADLARLRSTHGKRLVVITGKAEFLEP